MAQSLLDIPEKLKPLIAEFNHFHYFLLKGGRGGGKTQAVARFLLTLAEKYNLRIVCGREIQVNIAESVHSVFVDLIKDHTLAFEILQNKIIHRVSGSTIHFRGFREQGAFNIQGMEGVDITWIDEAQAITKITLDHLIPTIMRLKTGNPKVIFSMNPHVVDDAVVEMFRGREDCLAIDINYNENEYCPPLLTKEAEICKDKDTADYEHIWLGKPLDKSEDAVYTYIELTQALESTYPLRKGYGLRIGGFDIARYGDDKCAAYVLQQMGALHWEEVFCDEWGHKDLNYTTGRILAIINEQKLDHAIIDEDGIGGGPLDTLRQGRGMDTVTGFRNPTIAYSDNKDYANERTVNAYKLKKMLTDEHIHFKSEPLIKELTQIKYTYDHQQRKILISKQMMRSKFKIKSPNMADACIMAVSGIGKVQATQERHYRPQYTESPEESLFKLAGVK